jgi:anti-anti-sigma regulatory factor
MTVTTVDINTDTDGTLVIRPHGSLDATDAVDLRRTLVEAIRHTRPLRLIVDLSAVREADPINIGTLAAACHLGDDHKVAVFLDHSWADIAAQLAAAGVPTHRLRHITSDNPLA